MAFGKNYTEIVDAPKRTDDDTGDDRKLVIWDHPEEDETWEYEAYVPHDVDGDVLVLDDSATDEVRNHVERHGWDVVWEGEARKTLIREPIEPRRIDEEPPTVVYLDDPPENRIIKINPLGAQNLVEHRYGLDIPRPRHAWYWPEYNDAAVLYPDARSPQQGNLTHIPVQDLSQKEKRIANCLERPSEDGESTEELRRQIEDRAEELEEKTFFSRREAEAVAARELGLQNQKFADVMGRRRTIANQHVTRAKKKWQKIKDSYQEVDPDIFEDRRGAHWEEKRDKECDS